MVKGSRVLGMLVRALVTHPYIVLKPPDGELEEQVKEERN